MAKRAIKTSSNSSLLNALEFLAPVMKDDGTPSQTHVVLYQKYAVAFDGIICIGHPIDEELAICPQYNGLLSALKKSKDTVAISAKDNRLSIKSGRLNVTVPCIDYNQIMSTMPDRYMWAVNESMLDGFQKLVDIIKDDDTRIISTSLNLSNGIMIATDGAIYFEYWHGCQIPTMIVPKRVISIVSKIKKKLVGLGATENRSITFYFEDGSYIKSQLCAEKWPDISFLTSIHLTDTIEFDKGLCEAIESVLPHSDQKSIYMIDNYISSHHSDQGDIGAKYEIKAVNKPMIFDGERLLKLLKLANTVNFNMKIRGNDACGFYGNNIRGFLIVKGR